MQEEVQSRPGRLQRWSAQLLDGENRWGFVRIQIDRFGVTRYRLVVYPPGISDVQRRRLRIWRGAAVWGAALWVLSEIVLQQLIGPWTALAVSTGGVLALAALAMANAGETRTMVRSMDVVQTGATTYEVTCNVQFLGVNANHAFTINIGGDTYDLPIFTRGRSCSRWP